MSDNRKVDSSVDLFSYSTKKRNKKKYNIKLIITNVFLSLVLVFSTLAFVGIQLLNSRILIKKDIGSEAGDFENIITSANENVSYFLVVGTDLSQRLTDIVMVVCYDLANNSLNILQLPRDTYIGTEAGYTKKLNAVYSNAREGEAKINALIRSINARFGLPIDHYVTVTIPGFRDIIDYMGGLDITLDKKYRIEDSRPCDNGGNAIPLTIGPGEVHLEGFEVEGLIRNRKDSEDGSDIGRVKSQRMVYAAIAKKVTSISFSQVSKIVTNCMDDVSTDLQLGQMLGYAQKLHQLKLEEIKINALPGQFYNSNGQSYFAAHKQSYLDLVNENFFPYETKILTVDDITLVEPQSNYKPNLFDDDDTTLDDFDTQKDK